MIIFTWGEEKTEQRDVGGSIVYVERYALIFKIKIPTWAEAAFTWGVLETAFAYSLQRGR